MHMAIRRNILLACAFCAVALASAPRMALAQIVELEFSVSGNLWFYDNQYPSRRALTEQYPLSLLDLTTGTSISYSTNSSNSTYNTYYYQYNQEGFMSYIPVSAGARAGSSTLPMSKYPEVALFFDCTNLDLTEITFRMAIPRYMMYAHRPAVLSTNNSVPVAGSLYATNYIYVLPHGADRTDYTQWVSRVVGSDGFFHIGYAVDAIAVIMCYEESFQSSPVQFSSFDPYFLFFGSNELPHLYFNFPNLDNTASSADVAAAAASINGSIASQTSSINSTITSQTNSLMDTSGSSDILSGQIDSVGDSLEQGVFGQFDSVQSTFLDVLQTSNASGGVYFPGISVLGYELVSPRTVNVWQYGTAQFQTPVRCLVTFVFFCAWFNGMVYIFQHQILGIDLIEGANVYSDVSTGGTGSHYRRIGR